VTETKKSRLGNDRDWARGGESVRVTYRAGDLAVKLLQTEAVAVMKVSALQPRAVREPINKPAYKALDAATESSITRCQRVQP